MWKVVSNLFSLWRIHETAFLVEILSRLLWKTTSMGQSLGITTDQAVCIFSQLKNLFNMRAITVKRNGQWQSYRQLVWCFTASSSISLWQSIAAFVQQEDRRFRSNKCFRTSTSMNNLLVKHRTRNNSFINESSAATFSAFDNWRNLKMKYPDCQSKFFSSRAEWLRENEHLNNGASVSIMRILYE